MGIASKLRGALGRDKVIDDPGIIRLYTREPSGLEAEGVEAVVFPEDAGDVRKLVRLAYKMEFPVYPQGSATSLSGNAYPVEGGVVVSFERMRRLREVNIVDGTVVVEPGLRLDELNNALASYGYMFPVDPASSAVATVGGAINNGAGGMRGAKYGTMRDWVLGLELVVADEDASLVRVGCRTVKCRQGYDLTRLIVGSEGTLGLVTEAVLRITPIPEQVVYILAFYERLEDLAQTVIEIKQGRVTPYIAEFMEAETVERAKRLAGVELDARGHMLLVGVDVYREAAGRMLDWLSSIAVDNGAHTLYRAWTTEEALEKGLFSIRKNLFTAQVHYTRERLGGAGKVMVLIEDIVVPPSRLVEAVEGLVEISKRYGFTMMLGGHIGDGNLHPAVGFDPRDSEERRRVEEWYHEVMRLALRLGGSVSAEHGIGTLKKEGLELEARHRGSEKLLELMRGVKRVFDPKGILNPGKVV
ncbi:MAG: FAD-binding protein [Desulfurococcales archaeon]|nr:FAD-binding protein [Desulfurococcales archaeon]